MVNWNTEQQKVLKEFGIVFDPSMKEEKILVTNGKWLNHIPKEKRRYKCLNCLTILNDKDTIDGKCICGNDKLIDMCPLDHCHCNCNMGIPIASIKYCPICGEAICPECGTHDVEQITRVTGYLNAISGFNNAKKQEVKDRVRYNGVA